MAAPNCSSMKSRLICGCLPGKVTPQSEISEPMSGLFGGMAEIISNQTSKVDLL